jgi:hypothetical protein
VDLIVESGRGLAALEVKSGATFAEDWARPLSALARVLPGCGQGVVYGGEAAQSRGALEVFGWREIERAARWARGGESE